MVDLIFAPPGELNNTMDMFTYIINQTDIGFGPILPLVALLAIGYVLFLMMKAFTVDRALAVAAFITSIIGIGFRIIHWINDYQLYAFIIVLVGSIYFLMKQSEGGL